MWNISIYSEIENGITKTSEFFLAQVLNNSFNPKQKIKDENYKRQRKKGRKKFRLVVVVGEKGIERAYP